MLDDLDFAFKNLTGRERRKARRMLDRAMKIKDDKRVAIELTKIENFIKKCAGGS